MPLSRWFAQPAGLYVQSFRAKAPQESPDAEWQHTMHAHAPVNGESKAHFT
jgi:hypothetical protein